MNVERRRKRKRRGHGILSHNKVSEESQQSITNGSNPHSAKPDALNNDSIGIDAARLLPVMEAKNAIISMVRDNPCVIIVGETGSGKTTQIPQFINDYILKGTGKIVGCTQPRRVAAISVATYVAQQRNTHVGGEVGYSVRFDERCSSQTKIRFMTDGILLRELLSDPMLSKYGAICCDEAHERTLHGDILFGLLKALTRRRSDLKIIVMSATMNAQKFSEFWRNAPIGVVHGRSFPYTVLHTTEPQADYVDACINTVIQIHLEESEGDILCFLTGKEEIEDAKRVLEQRMKVLPQNVPNYIVLPIYAALPYEEQMRVFEKPPGGQRKIILATNIAETSITIEGIKYVIDSGMVKCKFFNPSSNVESLHEVCVSRAQATQRAGRAGRVSAGKCYRLFTEDAYKQLEEESPPEILRCTLISVVLQMKAMGIEDVLSFEFMDTPPPKAVIKAQQLLVLLGALDQNSMKITPLGRLLAAFPIEPTAAKAVLVAQKLGVEEAVIAIIAAEDIFLAGGTLETQADRARQQFFDSSGDHMTLLKVCEAYLRQGTQSRRSWCERNGLNYRQMQKALDVMAQLREILTQLPKLREEEDPFVSLAQEDPDAQDCSTAVRRALCAGFFTQAAYFDPTLQLYRTVVGQQAVYIHPSSVLYQMKRKAPLLIFNNAVETTRRYIKDISIVREAWLQEASPNFIKTGPSKTQ